MLELAKPEQAPAPLPCPRRGEAELPVTQLKVPTVTPAEPMPLAALRDMLSEVERSCEQLRKLTVQAESFGEDLRQRAEKAEEARRWLEQENRELHERLQRVEERIPRWETDMADQAK